VPQQRGLLIAFEGGDGSGKSTQAAIAAERLGAVLTRQSGGTPFGEKLRSILLDPATAGVSLRAEALLFMADRAEHVDKVVGPSLADGFHVVSDRWAYSSFVYQGYGRGLDVDELRRLSDWSMNGLWPDLVVFLDIPLETGASRVNVRNETRDHFELAGIELQQRVVSGYHELANADTERWRIVDGTGAVDEVAERVWSVIEGALAARD
jgi:dTMP kinase